MSFLFVCLFQLEGNNFSLKLLTGISTEKFSLEIKSSEVGCDDLMSSDDPPLLFVNHHLKFKKNLQHQLLPIFNDTSRRPGKFFMSFGNQNLTK